MLENRIVNVTRTLPEEYLEWMKTFKDERAVPYEIRVSMEEQVRGRTFNTDTIVISTNGLTLDDVMEIECFLVENSPFKSFIISTHCSDLMAIIHYLHSCDMKIEPITYEEKAYGCEGSYEAQGLRFTWS